MVSSLKPRTLVIRASKIVHKSLCINSLARFVTEEAICLMFRIGFGDIHTIECWRYVVYIHAKGVSRFVSYADFPPILGVEPPTPAEFVKWRRRWRKQHDYAYRKQAPEWWTEFFINEFWQAISEQNLQSWGELIAVIKFAFTEETLQELRKSYRLEKSLLS
ncbi:hypothetical protein BCD64_21535 [Nostoc sp. MBR 210]|uniref:Uncharacterized protein n=1 Tax=Nostoc spongiaeforme FACHB-130 TaxID=1357510 RepID=A0ABR8G528_9NOSO|nr:hypothetical protein [Nostoc spongiaeforme]MBD2598348.1 hypothetical protein [Nostoc spongiaeforme FACHB-130]OCQ97429.1 hypothetical protein BCD64_21535 [Nostoc sp. MBR 210]